MKITPVGLLLILSYVWWLAFSVGRLYEQLKRMKQDVAEQEQANIDELPSIEK